MNQQLSELTNALLSESHEVREAFINKQPADIQQKLRLLIEEATPAPQAPTDEAVTPILGLSDLTITIRSGFPGSGKSYKTLLSLLTYKGITVYAVHDRNSIDGGDSRKEDLLKMERDAGLDSKNIMKFYIYSREDGTDEDRVNAQWEKALSRISETDDQIVMFVTHRALELIDFSQLPEGTPSQLIIDEVPEAISLAHTKTTAADLEVLMKHLLFTTVEADMQYVVKVEGINDTGRAFMFDKNNGIKNDTKELYNRLSRIDRSRKDNFIVFNKASKGNSVTFKDICSEDDGTFEVTPIISMLQFIEIINTDCMNVFDNVMLLGDDAEASVLVLLLQRTRGVKTLIDHIEPRIESVGDRINHIYYLTEHTYGGENVKMKGLYSKIARTVEKKLCDGPTLWLSNNNAMADTEFTDIIKKRKEDVLHSPSTHGQNQWKHMPNVVMMYSTKGQPGNVRLLEHIGISEKEQRNWTEFNAHVQNGQRGWLRGPSGQIDTEDGTITIPENGILVLPDRAGAEAYVARVLEEFGENLEDKLLLLDDDLSEDFKNDKTGPKIQGDREPLPAAARSKLSTWRKTLPRINDYIDEEFNGDAINVLKTFKKPRISSRYKEWLETQPESWGLEHLEEWIKSMPEHSHASIAHQDKAVVLAAYNNWLLEQPISWGLEYLEEWKELNDITDAHVKSKGQRWATRSYNKWFEQSVHSFSV